MSPIPSVTIVVPCRNEVEHIEKSVRSILAQDPPPGGFEVIVADGMSDDGTREILLRLLATDCRLRLIDNPQRITPCGMNRGIRAARGKYVGIMGAHTRYASDYIRRCVELLEQHPEICCSGGPIISQGKSLFGKAVAAAMSHPVGVGNAKHRFPDYEGYAEGACFPMFRREVFDQVGLYDESLPRNQDDDLNYRVRRNQGRIFISPRAWAHYWVRESIPRLFDQYFQYGYWRVAVLRKHKLPASWRQLVPIVFYTFSFVFFLVGLMIPGWLRTISGALPAAYLFVLLGAGLGRCTKEGLLVAILFPLAAAIMHFAYAAGFLWNLVQGISGKFARLAKAEG